MRGLGKNLNNRLAESELKYHSVFDHSFDGILLTAPDGRILAANQAACKMFGWSEEEICKLGRNGIMNTNDPRLALALEERELTGKFAGELTGLRSDGTIFPVELTTSVFADSRGEKRTSMIIRDISFRMELRDELDDKESSLRSILENTDSIICLVDQGFRVIDGNPAFRTIFQSRTGHLLERGDNVLEWLSDKIREKWKRYLTRGLTGISFTAMSIAGKGAQKRFLRFSFNPVRNRAGEVTGLTIMGTDISDLILMQKSLERTGVMLKEAQSLAKVGNWEYDIKLNKADWSDELRRIFGLPEISGELSWSSHLERIHPDDLRHFEEAVTKAYSEGIPFTMVFRLNVPGEDFKWIKAICKPERDQKGNVIRLYGTVQDITEQESTERKLITTEMLLRNMLSNAPLTIFATDKNGVFTLSEGRELKKVGLKPGENVGVSAYDLYDSMSYTDLSGEAITGREVLDQVLSGETMVLYNEFRGVYFENHIGPIINDRDEITGIVGIAVNITDQKKTENELAKSEERYRNLFEKSVIPISEIDYSEVKQYFDKLSRRGVKDFRKYFTRYPERAAQCFSMMKIRDLNKTSLQFFGLSEKSELMADIERFLTEESVKCLTEEIIALAEGMREFDSDMPLKMPDGKIRHVHIKMHVLPDAGDTLSQVLVSWLDITDRINYEQGLKISGETLRMLNMHIEEAREKERSQIAMNLHDDLGQKLTALKMNLSWLAKRIGVQSPLVNGKLEEINRIIENTIKSVQKMSSELRPAILYDLGLKEAVEWHMKQNLEPAGIKGSFRLIPENLKIDEKNSVVLFRIIQEALTNIIRHSGAGKANIRITRSLSFIELVIKDNGKGIDAATVNDPKSFGIASIKERVRNISGHLRITGDKERGTLLIVRIPVNKVP